MAVSSVTTMRAPLRASRSRISLSVASVVVGTMTAPILMAASMSSQMAATFGRHRTIRSPGSTPWRCRKCATRSERSANSW